MSTSKAGVSVDSPVASFTWRRCVSLLRSRRLSDETSSSMHGVVSCPVMFCPKPTAVLWAAETMGWMTFVTPILVSSLGGARARLAQTGAQRTDVIWEVWEVFDHDTSIRARIC